LLTIFIKSLRKYFGFALLGLSFWIFLGRGGIVIEFYITPLIPIMALCIGVVLGGFFIMLTRQIKGANLDFLFKLATLLIVVLYFEYNQTNHAYGQHNTGHFLFESNQTAAQIQAVEWIRTYLNPDDIIVIDNYSFLELRIPKDPDSVVFPNAHWYWKVDQDPEIKVGVMKNSAELIDAIAATPQMRQDLSSGSSPLTSEALGSSKLVKSFNTYGWGVEIWVTQYPSKILKRAWNYYKNRFLVNGEYTVDPANNLTTSEGQSYALMRAVWMDDKETFDKVWNWTKNNLMNESGTFSWKWGMSENGVPEVLDRGSAADGDTDTALALIFASKKWKNGDYLKEAQSILSGVWNTEVKTFNGANYLVPGNWAKGNDSLIINPSYLSPYAYKIFAEVDQTHNWNELVGSSYEALERCMSASFEGQGTGVGLPPNWCAYDQFGNAKAVDIEGLSSTEYSYDAIRTMWRLALDYEWFKDERAKRLLDISGNFLRQRWLSDGKILVGYTHDGSPWENYDSVLGYSTNLSNLKVTNPDIAKKIYEEKVINKFYEDFDKRLHYWEDPNNYYTQNWAWFGIALYADKLPNLWLDQSKTEVR
jgi:endoglucanase